MPIKTEFRVVCFAVWQSYCRSPHDSTVADAVICDGALNDVAIADRRATPKTS